MNRTATMTARKPSRPSGRHHREPAVERLEPRTLLAADNPGVFASQQGVRDGFAPAAAEVFTIGVGDFRTAATGSVLLRIASRVGPFQSPLQDLSVTSVGDALQTRTADGGLLVRVTDGTHRVAGRFGWVAPGATYAIDYRLAGDVDGSCDVTAADLDLIRTGMATPSALPRPRRAAADVDGNRVIDGRDLRLATSNLGASTSVRPLRLQAAIGPATPSHQGVVRLGSCQIAADTTPDATVVFVNAALGERRRRTAGPDGSAAAELRLEPSAVNRIAVSARDAFGQRLLRHVTVHQRPTPVVIVPGWATSGPANPFDLPDFLRQLGYPAGKLAVLAPASLLVYGQLRDALAAAGHARDRDQFIVPYDWRLPIAPDDGVRDGTLSLVTAESILRPQPTFSLGYLGNFLAKLVSDDPSIVTVHMLGHSNGGLLTRAYIQSAAYGASFTAAGRTLRLPGVDGVFLVAAPSLGSAISLPFWNNDAASFGLSSVLGHLNLVGTVLGPVYDGLVGGGRSISGPAGIIDRAAVTDPATGLPDPARFLQLYLASLRDLLPTYAVLRGPDGGLVTIDDTPAANHLLLDLNAASSPGVNPWTAAVGQVTVTFGVHPVGFLSGRPVTTETFVRPVVADGRTGSIWPFQRPAPVTPAAGTTYFARESFAAGDDMVPGVSLAATYADDPSIVVRAWGNGPSRPGLGWTPTRGGVRHAGLLSNRDVLAFIRSRLGGPSPAT